MTDERTPVEGDADFDATAPDYRVRDERTPTAEPVRQTGHAWTPVVEEWQECSWCGEPKNRHDFVEAEAAQRSTAEVERLYARLVVDGNDVDVNAYRNDPIYKGIVYRIHRGTPRAALAEPDQSIAAPRPYGEDGQP
jgi:hypothetical protein